MQWIRPIFRYKVACRRYPDQRSAEGDIQKVDLGKNEMTTARHIVSLLPHRRVGADEGSAQRFLSVHAAVQNTFNCPSSEYLRQKAA